MQCDPAGDETVQIPGPIADDLRECPCIGRDGERRKLRRGRAGRIDGQGPGFARTRDATDTDDDLDPLEAAAVVAGHRLVERAAEDDIGGRRGPGRGPGGIRDLEIDIERLVTADGQDLLRYRLHIEVALERRAVEPGELEGELVHARVEARALAVECVEVEGLAVVHDAVAVVVHTDRVHRAVGLWIIGLLGQAERIVEEALGAGQRAADDGQRPANRVHPFVEGREDQGIAAIDHLVVDRHHRDRPHRGPVGSGKQELRHHRCRAGGAQTIDRRRIGKVRRAGQTNQDLGVEILVLIRGRVADGDDAAAHDDIEDRLVEQRTQLGGDVGQGVAELRGVTDRDRHKRRSGLDILDLEGPGFAGGDVALQLDADGSKRARGRAAADAGDLDRGRPVGGPPHIHATGAGVDADRDLGEEGGARCAGDAGGYEDLWRLGTDQALNDSADLQRGAERGAAGQIENQQLSAVGRRLEPAALVDFGGKAGRDGGKVVGRGDNVGECRAANRQFPVGVQRRSAGELDREARGHPCFRITRESGNLAFQGSCDIGQALPRGYLLKHHLAARGDELEEFRT